MIMVFLLDDGTLTECNGYFSFRVDPIGLVAHSSVSSPIKLTIATYFIFFGSFQIARTAELGSQNRNPPRGLPTWRQSLSSAYSTARKIQEYVVSEDY